MIEPIIIDLPWPPSVNTYWRHPTRGTLAGRHLISQEGRTYRSVVQKEVSRHAIQMLQGRLAVRVDAMPPDHRKRDLDNLCKGVLDALVHAGAIQDDGDIDLLTLERGPVVAYGLLRVTIKLHTPRGRLL